MKNISKTEKAYQELFKAQCPRAIEPFPICLMEDWSTIIEEVSEENIILSQFIKGKTGNRELNKTLIDETIGVIEGKIVKHLRRTEEGLAFYKTHKKNSVKMLTFCVLGCKKILKERGKKKVGISKIKSLLTNLFLVYYYLMSIDASNATIQDYEERINKRWNNKRTDLIKTEERSLETVETAFDDDSFEIGEEFSQEEEEDIAIETNPPKVMFFDFTKILEGDPILTKILQNVCSTTDKHDFTCDVNSEIYSLVKVKLIHAFLQRTELFNDIDFTAECLHDGKFDIKQLRRTVKLYLRKYTKWELTPEVMDKFLLCSICHLVRELTALSKFDQIDGLEVFFKYYGEIFKIDKKTLEEKKRKGFKLLQGEKEEEPDKQISQEKKTYYPLPDNNKIEEMKAFFEKVALTMSYDKLSPEEIVDKRSIAKSLLGITEEDNTQWIENISKVWAKEVELQQFLALVILDEFKEMEYKQISKRENSNDFSESSSSTFSLERINQEQIDHFEEMTIRCDTCKESQEECLNREKRIAALLAEERKKVEILWVDEEILQPCIAKVVLEQIEKGQF